MASDMNVAKVHGSIIREHKDPRDGYEPVGIWLIVFIFALTFWGGMYLAYNSGGFQSDVFNPTKVAWDGGGAAVQAGPPDPMVLGKKVFTRNCAVCHQATGLGVPGQFPPLAGSEWVLSQDWHGDNHLVKIVLKGLQGPVTVKGQQFNNAMTPWEQLKDEEIAAVLTFIRNEWGNSAPPISAQFVAEVRASTERSEPWTQKDLQAIPKASAPEAGAAPAEVAPAGESPAPAENVAPAPAAGA